MRIVQKGEDDYIWPEALHLFLIVLPWPVPDVSPARDGAGGLLLRSHRRCGWNVLAGLKHGFCSGFDIKKLIGGVKLSGKALALQSSKDLIH